MFTEVVDFGAEYAEHVSGPETGAKLGGAGGEKLAKTDACEAVTEDRGEDDAPIIRRECRATAQ
jgi:hypothetical protein